MAKKLNFHEYNGSSINGFSLIETMIALAILTFGLLAASPMIYTAVRSNSLARSQSTAGIAAQNKLELLAEVYRRNPSDKDLMPGSHGPDQIRIVNPNDESILNRYHIHWTVSLVPDPRPGRISDARLVQVAVTPIGLDGAENSRPGFNKILNISTIFSPELRGPTE
jgi:prepilin-type N-terminal cleavage/methylation domain-containing protein